VTYHCSPGRLPKKNEGGVHTKATAALLPFQTANGPDALQWAIGTNWSIFIPYNPTQSWKQVIYRLMQWFEGLGRVEGREPIPKGYILYNSIYLKFLKWQNCRNGKPISSHQGLRRKWMWWGDRYGYRKTTWEVVSQVQKCSVPSLCQCQHPGHDTVLQFCVMSH
jgi:hypothetical protein